MKLILIAAGTLLASQLYALQIDLGPDQRTNHLTHDVVETFGLGRVPEGPISFSLEFNKAVRIRDDSNFVLELGCSTLWLGGSLYSWQHIATGKSYVLDAEGNWIDLHQQEIDFGPAGATWLKIYLDDAITIYGVRFDWYTPWTYFGRPGLWLDSYAKPFEVGGRNVPETGSTLLLLGLAVLFCLALRRLAI
jgi:hypothetical protein